MAKRQGISFAEFVRRAIERQLAVPAQRRSKTKTGDPFWDNLKTFDDDRPTDLSVRHDDYLYGTVDDPQ